MIISLAKDVLERGMILRIDKYHADDRRAFKVWVKLNDDGEIVEFAEEYRIFNMDITSYLQHQLEDQLHDYIECHIANSFPNTQ